MAAIYVPTTKKPEISVIIAAYNAASSIGRALDSVVRQPISSEIIIANDASTDDLRTVLEAWSAAHPEQPLTLIDMPEHSYALKTRIAGLREARADNVLFLDADDEWYGDQNLIKALARKKDANVEIVHFRTFWMSPPPDSVIVGEFTWATPPDHEYLYGADIFAAYAEMEYPSLLIWNKIYSRSLLLKAAEYIKDCDIIHFDDKLFVSVILLCAQSWAVSNEFVYLYYPKRVWPLELYAKWVCALVKIKKFMEGVLPSFHVPEEAARNILAFFTRRMKLHCGNLCIKIDEEISQGEDIDIVLGKMTQWLPLSLAIQCVIEGGDTNIQRLSTITRRIYEQY